MTAGPALSVTAAEFHRLSRLIRGSVALLALVWATQAAAQLGAPPPPPPANPHAAAPQDLTGYWVSLVTEDWRYRMLTPDKGDYSGISLNPAGRALADKWDPEQDEASGNQCRSYGAAAIMRVPTRLHIQWQGDDELRVDTDAGQQTRMLHFNTKPPAPPAEPSWQGYSVASWEGLRAPGTGGVATTLGGKVVPQGYLKVVTTQLKPGYLRKNGVPYGPNTQVEEYFDSFNEPDGNTWLVVTTVVTDPEYLAQIFMTSSHFKKLPGPTGWNPTACEAR
jgi:hypothetical protein